MSGSVQLSLMGATILSFRSLGWHSTFVRVPEVGRLSWSDTFFLIVLFKPVKVVGMLFNVLGEINTCWIAVLLDSCDIAVFNRNT